MTSVIVALDVSPTNIGVASIDLETGALVASARINTKVDGWLHVVTTRGLAAYFEDHPDDVEYWVREIPMTSRSYGMATMHGYACACADVAMNSLLPYAWHAKDLRPGEWKRIVGLKGNANKDAVRVHAEAMHGAAFATQDEADAYMVGRATLLELERAADEEAYGDA